MEASGAMKTEPVRPEELSYVRRALTRLVGAASSRPGLVLTLALVACAASAVGAWRKLEYRTQRDDLVDSHKAYQQRWQNYLAEFGDDNDMVVVVKGADPTVMRRALEELATRVARRPDRFDRLFYKVDLRPLHSRALLFLSVVQIESIRKNLASMSLLLDPPVVGALDPLVGWRSLNLHRLIREARDRTGKILPDQPLSPGEDQFLTQLLAVTRAATSFLACPTGYRSPWLRLVPQPPGQKDLLAEPQYFFSGDGTLAFLLTQPIREEASFTGDRKSVEAMRAIIGEVAPLFPGLELGLTGLPVLDNDEIVASQGDTNLASLFAIAGVGALYLLVFRGLRYPALTVATLLVGTVWAMGWLTLTVGHLNILSATFVVMLVGMGDYGVLWVTRYEQNRQAGADVGTALRLTAVGGGPSILTAASATALAFFATMMADFQAVAELGWIAGSGVLLCALSCFTVLPALLVLTDKRRLLVPVAIPLSSRAAWLPALARRPRLALATAAALALIGAAFAGRVVYDHNLLHLQAPGLDSVKWEMTLIEHTAGASWHALSYTDTIDNALELKARYEKLPEVSRVVEVASLVPGGQDQKIEQLADIQDRLRHLPPRGATIPHDLPDLRLLRTELDWLAGSLQPLADSISNPLLDDLHHSLVALRDKVGEAPPEQCAERVRDFEQQLAGDLVEDLHRLREVSQPQAIGLADLPAPLRVRYVGRTGAWLLRVFAKDCLWEHGPLKQFVNRIREVDPEATGKPFATLEGLQSLKHGFAWAGLYALIAIVATFWLDFRDPRHTAWALAPLALGVVISLGIMGACGQTLNPATIIAFPLILGVGAVYGVHVVHDYSVRGEAKPYTLSYVIGRAVLVMALANMISFGTLSLARHRGLSGLGFILTLGVTCCMLTALVFLPALLRLLGRQRPAETPPAAEPARRAA